MIKGTIVHPESLPHWLGWWYCSGVVSDSSSLCRSFKLVVDLKALMVFKACVSLRCIMIQKPSVLVSETKDPEAGLGRVPFEPWTGVALRWACATSLQNTILTWSPCRVPTGWLWKWQHATLAWTATESPRSSGSKWSAQTSTSCFY